MKKKFLYGTAALLLSSIVIIISSLIVSRNIEPNVFLISIVLFFALTALLMLAEWRTYKYKFNKRHPELRTGEVFYNNSYTATDSALGWKYKRVGEISYDDNGKKIDRCKPIFLLQSEMKSKEK